MYKKVTPPYFGVAYYPESWAPEQMDEDIAMMVKSGINSVRIGEFAWTVMEPTKGQYDFSLFLTCVQKLRDAGLAYVMGTPTCTPPAWMSTTYPEILQMNHAGVRQTHGARRLCCVNNPVYLDFCDKIVEAQAKAFAEGTEAAENLIGWQIDNELHYNSPDEYGCCCPDCKKAFHIWLQEQYETVENMNACWGTATWSQRYDSFDQVPTPVKDLWHHPAYKVDWQRFRSWSYARHAARQAAILKKYSAAPIGTDMMPLYSLDHEEMNRALDIVQTTEYRDPDHLDDLPMWFSYYWNLKDKPFWVVETACTWGGATFPLWRNPMGYCRANTWLPMALGADAMMYWLWRTHHSGQEIAHGAVMTTWGRPSHIFGEVQQVAAEFEACKTFLTETVPTGCGLGLHFSMDAARTVENQLLSIDLKTYNERITAAYMAFREAQMNPSVLDPAHDLSGYKVIMSPYLTCIEHKGLRDRLKAWIEAGGTWIAGPYTDVRNQWDGLYKEAPFGVLEDWADIRCDYTLPHGEDIPVHFTGGETVPGSVVFDALVCGEKAESLATYQEEGFLKGYSAVTVTPMGKGKIVVLGTILPPDALVKLVTGLGIAPSVNADSNVVVIPRAGATLQGWICVEIKNRPGKMQAPADCTDLMTGVSYKKDAWVAIPAYGVAVLQA